MQCAVPSCPGWEKALVPFPQNLVLQSRWKRAIEAGTGLRIPTYHCGALCAWHFGDDQTRKPGEYWEPYRFLHPKGKPVEVGSCRFCLRFDERRNMISDRKVLLNAELVTLVRYALKIDLTEDDILKDICKECESKVGIIEKWIKNSKQTESEYKALEVATKKSFFKPIDEKSKTAKMPNTVLQENDTLRLEIEFSETKVENLDDDQDIEMTDNHTETIIEDEIVHSEDIAETENINQDHGYAKDNDLENVNVEVREQLIIRPLKPVIKKFDFPPNTHCKRGPKAKPKSAEVQIKYGEYMKRKCSICDTILETPEDLVAHLTQEHSSGGPYRCTECQKSFKLITSYNRHLGFHDKTNRPLKCCYCPMGFKYNYSLLNHENRQHGAEHQICTKKKRTEKIFQCTKCDKAYKTNYDLLDHDRFIHQRLPGTTCKLCGKHFRNRACLRKHHLVHTGDRPYNCPHCDAVFRNSTSVVRHVAHNHEGIEPVDPDDIIEERDCDTFQCIICPEEFVTQPELVKHIESTHMDVTS
ncbi:zinc finger protein 184-like [Armigeres subalbatus]|uniref:zinc finger protein 184-like n=1 Tax=Armigeres subalbatus TaxID=124917 RepID=UPI002ED01A14